VLHGGGNTSVKTAVKDLNGETTDVLCVKGSGWDMGEIEPPGLPAVRLAQLRALEDRNALSDEEMVQLNRANLIDPSSPSPSVETLLHAFLPHKFVDHTHANAVLALSDQPDGKALCEEVYRDRATVLPWVMPGFDLARACAVAYRANPDVDGLVLDKHGIFSFGETAEEAYERMIDLVDLAEQRLKKGKRDPFVQVKLPKALASVAEIAPVVRGRLANTAGGRCERFVLEHRTSPKILAYVGGKEIGRYSQQGTVTPDHVIRTKPRPVVLPAPEAGKLDDFAAKSADAVSRSMSDYVDYFERNNQRLGGTKTRLDVMPRVALVPGIGLFAAGKSAKEAKIAADIAEATPLDLDELFDMEYWSLEQAKLGKGAEMPLQRQVVAITGGGGTIGRACAEAFRTQGAEIALIDLPGDGLDEAADATGALAAPADLTDAKAVQGAFDAVCETFGGLDILVSNAGGAWQGAIGEVDEETLRASFELNFWGQQRAAQAAVKIMAAQGTGGSLLFNITKQAVNPGPDFGPYGIPKAAALALMRQYALDYGRFGIRANAVNADRIRGGLLTEDMIAQRSKARGLSEADYMGGNLLHREVTAADVARAFVDLALSEATTGAVMTVDGGNVAAMLR